MNRSRAAVGLFLGMVLMTAGCTQTPKPAPAATQPKLSPDVVAHNASVVELATDQCATQLQDIGGALAIYYHERGGMPDKLESLVPLAKKWGLNLVLRCPLTGDPYIYVPSGLASPGQPRRLVVYEAQAVHDGWRWGVVMAPPPQGMTTVTPEVVRLSDEVLKVYLEDAPK